MFKKRVDAKFATKEQMQEAFEKAEFKQAIANGEKEIAGAGKVLIRKSGTEPKIQVWVWGDDKDRAIQVNHMIADILSSFSGFESFKDVL